MNSVYLSLGTNLGSKSDNLNRAEMLLTERAGRVVKSSGHYATEPWGMQTENEFLNAVILLHTEHEPHALLCILRQIEVYMGRIRKSQKGQYEDRIIDIDILYYNDQNIQTPELTIPHPLIEQRSFILEGLKRINFNI